jgi:hypothetical protein
LKSIFSASNDSIIRFIFIIPFCQWQRVIHFMLHNGSHEALQKIKRVVLNFDAKYRHSASSRKKVDEHLRFTDESA